MQYLALTRLALAGLALAGGAASAQTNLIQNGGFESLTTAMPSPKIANYSDVDPKGWVPQTPNYSTLLVGETSKPFTGDYASLRVLRDFDMSSPDGGNFVIASAYYHGPGNGLNPYPFSQEVKNLTVGQQYAVSFYQAASATDNMQTAWWNVSFGGVSQTSAAMTNARGTNSPWSLQTLYFTATNSTQLLTFLATGSHVGAVPVIPVTLDGVSIVAVPEPATATLALAGLLGLGLYASRRKAKRNS